SPWVIQGELMGPGVQGNQLGLTEPTLYVFQVRSPRGRRVDNAELLALADNDAIGLNVVPVECEFGEAPSLEWLQTVADNARLPSGKPAEGIVVRPHSALAFGNGRPAGFKIINRNYGE